MKSVLIIVSLLVIVRISEGIDFYKSVCSQFPNVKDCPKVAKQCEIDRESTQKDLLTDALHSCVAHGKMKDIYPQYILQESPILEDFPSFYEEFGSLAVYLRGKNYISEREEVVCCFSSSTGMIDATGNFDIKRFNNMMPNHFSKYYKACESVQVDKCTDIRKAINCVIQECVRDRGSSRRRRSRPRRNSQISSEEKFGGSHSISMQLAQAYSGY